MKIPFKRFLLSLVIIGYEVIFNSWWLIDSIMVVDVTTFAAVNRWLQVLAVATAFARFIGPTSLAEF